MAMIEILKRRHDAIFIQSESRNIIMRIRRRDRPRRGAQPNALPLARPQLRSAVGQRNVQILLDNGMTREEYEWFLEHRLKQHCIFGNDYYQLNEHRVFADGHTVAAGETFGYAEITRNITTATDCR
jgi:hypothetical protein